MTTDLYVKSANKHQCLHYTLSYSDSIKRSIVYSQVVTDDIGYRICLKESGFQMHMFELSSLFKFALQSISKTILDSLNL